MASFSKSIPVTLPTTVRTDFVARLARYVVLICLSVITTAWTISAKLSGYDRAGEMTLQNRQMIFDHETKLAEHDKLIAVAVDGIKEIRDDVHEIRNYIFKGRQP